MKNNSITGNSNSDQSSEASSLETGAGETASSNLNATGNNNSSPGTGAEDSGNADQAGLQEKDAAPAHKGTVTLEGLQKELGDDAGRAQYLEYGVSFGITELNVASFHPPLDLSSIKEK